MAGADLNHARGSSQVFPVPRSSKIEKSDFVSQEIPSFQEFKSKSILSENDFGGQHLKAKGPQGKKAWHQIKQLALGSKGERVLS